MTLPALELYNHQETHAVLLESWEEEARRALPAIMAAAKSDDEPIHQLETIEISLVSDDAIAKVHGEIIISVDTAKRQAAENGESYEREVLRYMVHGLLHLAGWDDHEDAERV